MNKTKPVFIFSLPRSGSTLLQRMLSCHNDISTQSELWFLLPHIFAMTGERTVSEYSCNSLHNATEELLKLLPNGADDYRNSIKALADNIYKSLANGNKYIIDKTPRYYFIINEIEKIYPDAKFIFLFRHPCSVLSSLIESFYRNHLGDYYHRIDMYEGARLLANGFSRFSSKCYTLKYEDLVAQPEEKLLEICEYLEISYDEKMISDFTNVPVKGLGDQFGSMKYTSIEGLSVNKWKAILATSYRRKYTLKYLEYVGKDAVEVFGYDYDAIVNEVSNMPVSYGLSINDRLREIRSRMYSLFEIQLVKNKLLKNSKLNNKFYMHH